jgi:hypothetical protein
VGYAADLILWNRSGIKSLATYEHPTAVSTGVSDAFVNGVQLISRGKEIHRFWLPGVFLPGQYSAAP